MKSILDPRFKYTPSHATNVAKTFERIRKQQKPKAPVVAEIKNRRAA